MVNPLIGRRPALFSLVACALVAMTCRSTSYFDLDHHGEVNLTQDGGQSAVTFAALTHVNLAAHPLMEHQGLVNADLTEVTLKNVSLSINTPATGTDFGFIDSVQVVLQADGMQPITVAEESSLAAAVNLVPLTVTQAAITGYMKGQHPTFTLQARYRAQVPANLVLGLNLVSQVRVGQPGGSCQN